MHSSILYRLTYLAAAMSLGHHLDHLIRHNAVGWPLTDQVNAFGRRLLPIMAARWIFNGGTALALVLGLVG